MKKKVKRYSPRAVELGQSTVQTSTINCTTKHMTLNLKKRNWLQKFLLFLAGE